MDCGVDVEVRRGGNSLDVLHIVVARGDAWCVFAQADHRPEA